jgi:hypothetical protein
MTGSPEGSPIGAPFGTIVLVWLQMGKPEGRLSSLPNEMRTKLDLLVVGSTWLPFPEVAGYILTDLLLERNGSRKLDFRFMAFSEVQLTDTERRSVRRVMSSSCSQPSPTKE